MYSPRDASPHFWASESYDRKGCLLVSQHRSRATHSLYLTPLSVKQSVEEGNIEYLLQYSILYRATKTSRLM